MKAVVYCSAEFEDGTGILTNANGVSLSSASVDKLLAFIKELERLEYEAERLEKHGELADCI